MKRLVILFGAMTALAWGQEKQPLPAETADRNVELTVYLLSGLQAQAADDVPHDLAPIVRQLRSLFSYKAYKLTESFILRGRQGRAAYTQGILPGSGGLRYSVRYNRIRISPEKPYMLHIDGLSISVRGPPIYGSDGKQRDNMVASIDTDLDLADGQKTVVGKSSINSTGDALILVIVPKVLE